MAIKIFNSLTREKEMFQPLEEGKVKMYVCGPTVYNYIHIGNARPAIVFDTVRRYLEYRGYEVNFVSNFTDVDDKLIKAANQLGEDVNDIAERFIDAYHEDVSALGVERANVHPRVTENMSEIIAFIEQLIEKGYAYESEGDVYFKTKKFEEYGKLSQQSIDDLRLGSRIDIGEKKQDPLDFALWKTAKSNEISWESPWGDGRPGWHIECSALAKKYLGETIDIHAGGQDLKFPHHENEIAQSEALSGKTMANYWMHNGYININNEKMSKSLGNFVLVHDIIKKQDPEVIRFLILSVHYRHPINFNDELFESATNGLERIKNAVINLQHRKENTANLAEESGQWLEKLNAHKETFMKEMDDDFNTANAISVLFELSKDANIYLQEKNVSINTIEAFISLFNEIATVLGIKISSEVELLDEEIERLLEDRIQARKDRNFALADQIRDTLTEKGILLEDTPQGTRWRRK
ncbi:cysteine--tRNA ligase [Lottiidibacillus patelloidae]|uniref:Cysteine--tRNA ligase n=1 Tax=Lottiidibacillus patelloidae TaxID=2670334 RepID=A0A263BQ69_9BACI|nr:cysteine--tRNA ligase [Lottiidibacillus patelloidae]OZM55883.1 cysteine--tRNA ligase [Lottiidibacillus patelloidae]